MRRQRLGTTDRDAFSKAWDTLYPLLARMEWLEVGMRPKPKPRPRGTLGRGGKCKFIRFYMPAPYRKWQKEFAIQAGDFPQRIPAGRLALAVVLTFKVPSNCPKGIVEDVAETFHAGKACDVDNGAGAVMDTLLPDGDERVSMLIVVKKWGYRDSIQVGVAGLGEVVWPKKRAAKKKAGEP